MERTSSDAVLKVIHEPGKYHDRYAYRDVIHYACDPEKVRGDGVMSTCGSPEHAALAMEAVAHAYHQDQGVRLRHTVLSFDPKSSVDFDAAREIAKAYMAIYDSDYQLVTAIHEDTDHLHIHAVMNTVSYRNGHKYHGDKKDYYACLKQLNKAAGAYHVRVRPEK